MKLKSTDHTIQIGGSGGIAHIAHGATDVEALLKLADIALYAAKAVGKNRILPYSAAA